VSVQEHLVEHVHEHTHEHDHPHPHEHVSMEEPFVDVGPTAGPSEALVLDIGDDIGALILFAEEGCLGQEIDLTPVGVPRSHQMHTMVRRRRAVDREFIAGVYPELVEGSYVVWGLDGMPLGEVTVRGGQVSEFQAGNCRSQVEAPIGS
jgi:hypothetical protein